jgi:Glycosyl hydrolase family 59/Galactocerebrosidase, C-terminal lectin domain
MKFLTVITSAFLLPLPLTAVPHSAAEAAVPGTTITINGDGGSRTFDGVGAVLGGGGNARYLEEYPTAVRKQILGYLFKYNFGASLQLLKLEIGGDGNSTVGSEPSVEHSRGRINCRAGYEFAIAREALATRPNLKLYGLQWGAPAWVGKNGSLFTSADITYLIDWLNCAKKQGLTISYLGGWNERDSGAHLTWFHSLRTALNRSGYRKVQIVAGDSTGSAQWGYASSRDVAVLGEHNNCNAKAGAKEQCRTTDAARRSGKPLWGSELGGMEAGAQAGCQGPCAPAMDRAFTREYIDARVTGELEWPAIDSMPAKVLKYENRGLLTADEPWSGYYQVNAMTWAIAHITQFAWPPTAANPGGWRFLNSASGYLAGNRVNGSYVTLVRSTHDQWSTIIETTASSTGAQRVTFSVRGGHGLAGKTVHVWQSNFSPTTGTPAQWFVRGPDIKPAGGRFTLTVRPDHVYSLTTTSGQSKGTANPPAEYDLPLPYSNNLSAGAGQPYLLAAQDGAFELADCQGANSSATCTEQTVPAQPVLWSHKEPVPRHPYAIIGSDWYNYTTEVDVMIPKPGSAGLISRFVSVAGAEGLFRGYVFDVNTDGTYSLKVSAGGSARSISSGEFVITPPRVRVLKQGRVPFGVGTWHRLSLSVSQTTVRARVDGTEVASLADASQQHGAAGIEVGGWYPAYFSNLSISGEQGG